MPDIPYRFTACTDSDAWIERLAAAIHPHTAAHDLYTLSHDPVVIVQEKARRALDQRLQTLVAGEPMSAADLRFITLNHEFAAYADAVARHPARERTS